MWEIDQTILQIQDYALWEVIENGNSWVPILVTTPPEETGTSTTTKMTSPATIEEKTCKKNDASKDCIDGQFSGVEQKVKKSASASNNDKDLAFVTTSGSSTKAVKIEDASKKAMCAIDGAGFDWSDMARRDSGNMLYAFSDSEVVRLGINPMIQPEPEDLPKDNPKLEIAVLRVILFSIHNDEWKSFQCHHQTALRSNGAFKIMQKYEHVGQRHKIARWQRRIKDNEKKAQVKIAKHEGGTSLQQISEDKDQEHSSLNDKSNLTDLMKECHQ
ncbi:hypothetical protein Tco_0561669 [Tanacetum coccineum]